MYQNTQKFTKSRNATLMCPFNPRGHPKGKPKNQDSWHYHLPSKDLSNASMGSRVMSEVQGMKIMVKETAFKQND